MGVCQRMATMVASSLAVQISQLRDEVHAEFSALRSEIVAGDERVITTLREEIRAGEERVIATLREEIRSGDQSVMTQARVLYEDLKASLVLIQEGLPARKRPRRRNR
ncbi:MAG TPA: hypothetical protein VK504_13330 [Vicinamibacterales bacterium]|nr:hypothetical protein [Vicinamibacterales bacterium]